MIDENQRARADSNTERVILNERIIIFEKISDKPIELELPIKDSNDDCDDSYAWKVIEIILTSRDTVRYFLKEKYKITALLTISSVVAAIIHLILTTYVMYRFSNELKLFLFAILWIIIVLYIVVDTISMIVILKQRKRTSLLTLLYVGITFIYIMISILASIELQFTYLIINSLILFLSVNFIGLYEIISVIIIVTLFATFLIEGFVRFIICNICASVDHIITYNTYRYETEKTTVKQCMICLNEYKKGDVLCISKCHELHIFHEQCIRSWLLRNPTCPMCRYDAGFA